MFDRCLVKKAESHVIIFLLFLFLLLFLLRSSLSSATSSSDSRSNLGDQLLQVTSFKSLSEESWPVGLKVNYSSLEDGGDLVRSDGDIIISEDESSVDTGRFSRHDDSAQVSHGLSSTKRTRHKNSLVEVNQAILA